MPISTSLMWASCTRYSHKLMTKSASFALLMLLQRTKLTVHAQVEDNLLKRAKIRIVHLYYYRRRVCVFAKFDQFLPVRSHFDTKLPVNFFHVATFQSATFGRPLFAFVLCVLRQKIIKRTENARKAYRSA